MKRLLVITVLLLIASRLDAQSSSRLDAIARAQRDSGFSGVVLVARGDSILFQKAYSPVEGKALTLNSKFNIGSITKSFTAAAILRLRSERRLSFSDPV